MGEGLQCLQCGQSLDQDFGIVACANCGAVMMVDMDGNLQLTEDSSAQEPIPQEEIPLPPIPDENFAAPIDSFQNNQEYGSFQEQPIQEATMVHNPEEQLPSEQPVEEPTNNDSWFDQNLNQPTETPAEFSDDSAKLSSSSFGDVEDFGNQDVSSGALQYELQISKIDRADLRTELLQVLSDPRLYLNVRELTQQIRGGALVITELNAARASLILTRLQHLPLEFRWKQRVYDV